MKPLVVFPDPEAPVVNYLASKSIAGTVSVNFPASTLAASATHLQVELEAGNVADYPVTERAQVRVTAHVAPGKRTAVKELAALAQGHLCRLNSGQVAGVIPLLGRSDVITDPDTKNLMVWFTVRVDLKATQLAS